MNPLVGNAIRRVVIITTVNLAGFGGFLIYYVPNCTGLETTKKITQIYRCLKPAPVTENLEALKNEVMTDMKVPEEVRSQIELYHLYGFTPFTFGSTWKSSISVVGGFNRALIGLPLNYSQDDKIFSWKDIVLNEKGKTKPINWSTEAGQQLQHSLTLSDKAKKFAISQQIYRASTEEVFFKGMLTAVLCPVIYGMAKAINEKGNLLQKPRKLRFVMYSVVLAFNATLWVFLKDLYCCHVESKADEIVATYGKEYIEGGLEYYEKLLSSNLSLRILLGKRGDKLYTIFGNEKEILRQRHMPVTYRRDFFKKKLEESS